jgi:hypothetical protein
MLMKRRKFIAGTLSACLTAVGGLFGVRQAQGAAKPLSGTPGSKESFWVGAYGGWNSDKPNRNGDVFRADSIRGNVLPEPLFLENEPKFDTEAFERLHMNVPHGPIMPAMIPLDYEPLRGRESSTSKHTRTPWLVLEPEHDDKKGITTWSLCVDMKTPTRVLSTENGVTTSSTHPPMLRRTNRFDLEDPYQLLLAGALLEKLHAQGVITDPDFVHTWNHVVMQKQKEQPEFDEDDPDAPVSFIAEPVETNCFLTKLRGKQAERTPADGDLHVHAFILPEERRRRGDFIDLREYHGLLARRDAIGMPRTPAILA